ncbi:MAG TPA: exodeoxyribonuclease III [Caulobacterales bacterium]|nr:exodeoxyribonuclease III [Caulobacterales bacterium]
MALTIACWNVNSILARLPVALAVLKELSPDVVCLQEIKCEDHRFPRLEIEDLGYNVETHGQKSYNGVAILSKHRIADPLRGLPSYPHEHARYLEAVIEAPSGPIRVASLYAPNGNPIGTEKFTHKLAFMDALTEHARALLKTEERFAIAGDYNIIPRDEDADQPQSWVGDALFTPEAKSKYRALLNIGLTDAFMQSDGRARQFTFWDYQAGAWRRDHGIRIDFVMLSPQAADKLDSVRVHKDARAMEKASDHVPVIATLRD